MYGEEPQDAVHACMGRRSCGDREHVGGQDRFYNEAFNYVVKKGLTGEIVGTMNSYDISTDTNTATFSISLSTGGTITGTYTKTDDVFTFDGP